MEFGGRRQFGGRKEVGSESCFGYGRKFGFSGNSQGVKGGCWGSGLLFHFVIFRDGAWGVFPYIAFPPSGSQVLYLGCATCMSWSLVLL